MNSASGHDPVGDAILEIRKMSRNGDVTGLITELSSELETDALPVRAVAIRHLAKIAEPRAAPRISEILKSDRREDVRVAAAYALGEIAQPESAEALESVLDDPSLPLQAQAIESLGKIGDQRSVPAVARKLESSDSRFRKVVIRALARIGGSEAARALEGALPGKGFLEKRRLKRALHGLR